jgi:hypothetical protein
MDSTHACIIYNCNGIITSRTVDIFAALYITIRVAVWATAAFPVVTMINCTTLLLREATAFSVIKDRAASAR